MVKEIEAKVEIKPTRIKFPSISVFDYQHSLIDEVDEGKITRKKCFKLFEQMLMVRTLEEMITEIVVGVYKPLQILNTLAQHTYQLDKRQHLLVQLLHLN